MSRAAARSSRLLRPATAALVVLSLALFLAAVLETAWLSDDAYITFRTIDNLLHGHGLRWNVAERVQSYTHPLWMLLVAGTAAITGEIPRTAMALTVVLSLGAVGLLARGAAGPAAAGLAVLLCALSRAFVDYSTSGLENALTHLLLATFFLLLWRGDSRPTRLGAWLAAGLLLVNRLDLALIVGPPLGVRLLAERDRRGLGRAAAAILPLAAWTLFAVVYYGFPVPNTAPAKLGTGLDRGALLAQSLHYFVDSLRTDPLTLVVIAAGIVAATAARDRDRRGTAAGIVLYLIWVAWIGGDFMSGRFFSAPFAVAVLLLVSDPRAGRARWAAAGALAAAGLSLVSAGGPLQVIAGIGRGPVSLLDAHGIADERRIYHPETGIWAAEDRPRAGLMIAEARRVRELGDPLSFQGAIGLFGFHAGPDVHVVDFHALADPLLARMPAVTDDPLYDEFFRAFHGKPPDPPWRIGHFLRVVPGGYTSWLLGEPGRFADPRIEQLVERLALVTRGPLFAAARWREILRMNLRRGDTRIDDPRYRVHHDPDWREALAARPDFVTAHMRVADLDRASGNIADAAQHLEAALRLHPDNAPAASNLGLLYEESGQPERALALFRRATEADPTFPEGWVNLAHASNHAGRFDVAAAAGARAVELAPEMPEAWLELGTARAAVGSPPEALAALRRAIELRPEYGDAWYQVGALHARSGNESAAGEAWRLAVRFGSVAAEHALRGR
jgi:arabinofuranosyltransferase